MRDYKLKVEPFGFISLNEAVIRKEAGQHTSAFVRGTIPADKEEEYTRYLSQDENMPVTVTAYDETGQDRVLFQGVLTGGKLNKTGGVITMEVTGRSSSYLLDVTPHFRTFQDGNTVCSEIFSLLGHNYEDYNYILKSEDTAIGDFTVQYYETDWHFMMRMANRAGSFLVPADTFFGVRYYMGMPELNTWTVPDTVDFTMRQNYEEYDRKRKAGLTGVSPGGMPSFLVRDREIHEVGDIALFHGMKLYIYSIRSDFDGQELVHTCELRPEAGFKNPEERNERIIGASLDAQVLQVQQDQVQVKILGDEHADQQVLRWFPYSTVYSSPDGSGWYAMPEIGDLVRLYLPDKLEEKAVVFNAIHEQSDLRKNPDIKFMRNKYGKEIRFTPDSLVMTNNAGMEISIVDGEGVFIESDQAVSIRADGNIEVTSFSGVSMQGSDSVVVQQGGTNLTLDDNISFAGGKLDMQ